MDKVNINTHPRNSYQNKAQIFVKYTHISRERHGIFIPAVISQIPQDAEICADLGCGNAYYHNTILQKRSNISKLIGIDFSSSMLQMIPPQIKQNPKTQYILQDLTEPFSLKKQYFDCIVTLFTVEYVSRDKLDTYIKNCYNMLKPNGKLVILCCHVNNYKNDPQINKIVPYQFITNKKIIQDGEWLQVIIKKTNFRVSFIHWQDQTLINYLKMGGFQCKAEFLREQYIDKTLFNQQEIKTIVDSKGWRLVTGIKKSDY